MLRSFRVFVTGLLTMLGVIASAQVQEVKFFTIGTGGTFYTYFPVGSMIANAISRPPGSRPCSNGGSCGVENLAAMAVSSSGSLDNITSIVNGTFDAGLAQSDIAYWAHTGTGVMKGEPPAKDLRCIAALFQEHVHLVTLADSDIETVADLKGKYVALDQIGSGTYVDGLLVLQAAGLNVYDLYIKSLKDQAAFDALRSGSIDALFVIAGYPTAGLVGLSAMADIKLIPITGATADALISKHEFFSKSRIPEGMYKGVDAVQTIAVEAQLFTSARQDEDLIYNITKALWNKNSRQLFNVGHKKGANITLDTALNGLGVPLHPGAARFYKEAGLTN